jgi:hypothetical protein
MDSFTADDIEGGFTTVTPMLFIGKPPTITTYSARDAAEGAWRIRARNPVAVRTSDEAADILRLLDVPEPRIEELLHAARFGLLSTYGE